MRSRLFTAGAWLAVLVVVVQLFWFGSKAIHQIDFDGISYTRIATEVRLGEFKQSINAFRSPLISWLIAATPLMTELYAGKLISVLTFLSTLVLLYVLTKELWRDRGVALVAVLLLAVARGIPFLAVAFVTPDFLLATLGLVYFLVLLRSLRDERATLWSMGFWHAMAFLAKAIALPWLAACTFTAALCVHSNRRVMFARLASGLIIPCVIAAGWGSFLHYKYGVFTTGSQFKVNLLQWTLRDTLPEEPSRYAVLTDISSTSDEHMVEDPMPPGSWQWKYRPSPKVLVPRILKAEARNIPKAVKEIVILLTPGIVLATLVMSFVLWKNKDFPQSERVFAAVALVGSAALVLAYSMLVIDGRYFIPIVPLWSAIGSRLLFNRDSRLAKLRLACLVLVFVAIVWSTTYHASPWRAQQGDWQAACYQAGQVLKREHVNTVVSIGTGPYPEHGVGWEAGYKTAYFGEARLIATSFTFPPASNLAKDAQLSAPDAILVWSTNGEERATVESALRKIGYAIQESITDPHFGNVGSILLRHELLRHEQPAKQ